MFDCVRIWADVNLQGSVEEYPSQSSVHSSVHRVDLVLSLSDATNEQRDSDF
jgi:hypothetical protein